MDSDKRTSSGFRGPLCLGISAVLLFLAGVTDAIGAQNDAIAVIRVHPELVFYQPTAMYPVPGTPNHWWLLEKQGRVVAFDAGAERSRTQVVLDLRDKVDSDPYEAGLLGLAFDPEFPRTRKVYLSYTRKGAPLVSYISRFTVEQGRIDPDSEQVVLTLDQPYSNHNGGRIGFGPDGNLYIGFGDGGSGGDPQGNGQNTGTLLGAMLRIDVHGAAPYAIPPDNPFADGRGGRPELYAWGLRNPWRWSFDKQTGRLWAGDVGQNKWEEVDLIKIGGNYGWNIREGQHCYRATSCRSNGLTPPVAEYSHKDGCSVTGGYVYRGSAIPWLRGNYLFGDFCSGRIWALQERQDGTWRKTELLSSGIQISTFAQDSNGEIYLLDFARGGIYELVPRQPTAK